MVHGWRILRGLSQNGDPDPPTYVCTKSQTLIDAVVLSPDWQNTDHHVIVTEVPGILHRLLSFTCNFERGEDHPHVAYPPMYHFSDTPVRPFDWEGVEKMLEVRAEEWLDMHRQEGWQEYQAHVDTSWQLFERAYHAHLETFNSCVERDEQTHACDMMTCGRPKPQRCDSKIHGKLAGKRLILLGLLPACVFCAPSLTHRESETGWKTKRACKGRQTAYRRYQERVAVRRARAWRAKLFTRRARPTKVLCVPSPPLAT